MSTSRVTDFAERVKKFYYSRALLCEQLRARRVSIEAQLQQMPPDDYNPFDSYYIDSHVLACSALDGLSSIWKSLERPVELPNGNTARFVSFLRRLNLHRDISKVGTPFLYYFLDKQGKERVFKNKLLWDEQTQEGWLDLTDLCPAHRVYRDPSIDELKAIYLECKRQNPLPANETIKSIDKTLVQFTYAGLIYKFYRNSFIHAYRASKYVAGYSQDDIAVRHFKGLPVPTELPSGKVIITERSFVDGIIPQLDVAINVLTNGIRMGADLAYNLIEQERVIDIPDDPDDDIKIGTN